MESTGNVRRLGTGWLVVITLVGGCSATDTPLSVSSSTAQTTGRQLSPTGAASPTGQRAVGLGHVTSLEQLRDAAIAAGMPCPNWRVDDETVLYALASGSCSDQDRLSIYVDDLARRRVLAGLQQVAVVPIKVLAGPNWIISTDGASVLQDSLGGSVIMVGPTPTTTRPQSIYTFGDWQEHEGLEIRLSTPRQIAPDYICDDTRPWQFRFDMRNSGKTKRKLNHISFHAQSDSDRMVFYPGKGSDSLPDDILNYDQYLKPGESRSYTVIACPGGLATDEDPLRMKVAVLGETSIREFAFQAGG